MRIKGFVIAILVPIVSILIAVAAAPPFTPSPASATPGFARQTGVSCQACHTVFPELTPFGRKFKLNAYVFTNVKQLQATDEQSQRTLSLSDLPPLSVQLQASNTTLSRGIPDTGVPGDLSQQNDTQFPQALSLFYTGKIADNLGAFLQLTWNPSTNAVGIDNSDLRFANHASFDSIGVPDFIFGISLNNNPTSQDVWNSTPAWGYPYILSNVGVPPVTKALLDGQLAQESAGLSAYLFLFDHLYVEMGGYRSAQTSFTNTTTGGPGPLDSTSPQQRISGAAAPYWRVAWEQDWDSHSFSFGTYGISALTHPPGVGESGPTNTFTDAALDAQYQYITDAHIFSATATWIHEFRKFNNITMASNKNDNLDTARLTGSYFFRRKIGGSAQIFSTTGRQDLTLYASGTPAVGSANGKPNTQGAIFEIDYLPWLNTRIGLQYTAYSRFNGRSALTFRRAYNRLCEMFEKKMKEEAPYPQQVLAEKLDPFLMEDWNSAIEAAQDYLTEILELSKYGDKSAEIAKTLIHGFTHHDADINLETAKEVGLRVEKNDASDRNNKIWRVFRAWLGQSLFTASATHIIRYVLPTDPETQDAKET